MDNIAQSACNGKVTARLSIIIPTIGRAGLRATLASLFPQVTEADQVIVVADGKHDEAQAIAEKCGFPVTYHTMKKSSDTGYSARHRGMSLATGTHLVFMDDDDIFTETALRSIRTVASENPEKILIFRMIYAKDGRTLWHTPELRYGNVGSPMIVTPNIPARLGKWQPSKFSKRPGGGGGDYEFVTSTAKLSPSGAVIFRKEIVCIVRP